MSPLFGSTRMVMAIMMACVCVASLLLVPTVHADANDVVDLDPSVFASTVSSKEHDTLVKFFAPWCGHCQALAPTYKEVAEHFARDAAVVIAEVNCVTHGSLCDAEGVRGYPTIKFFAGGSSEGDVYTGARTKEALVEYVQDKRAHYDSASVADWDTTLQKGVMFRYYGGDGKQIAAWDRAEAACLASGGHLLSGVDSLADVEAVRANITAGGPTWLGLHNTMGDVRLRWSDEERGLLEPTSEVARLLASDVDEKDAAAPGPNSKLNRNKPNQCALIDQDGTVRLDLCSRRVPYVCQRGHVRSVVRNPAQQKPSGLFGQLGTTGAVAITLPVLLAVVVLWVRTQRGGGSWKTN